MVPAVTAAYRAAETRMPRNAPVPAAFASASRVSFHAMHRMNPASGRHSPSTIHGAVLPSSDFKFLPTVSKMLPSCPLS